MAKKEVKLLKHEIANCRVLASIFEEVISPIQNNVMRIAREHNLDQRLREQSKLAHDQIREITVKLKPLHRRNSAGFEKFRAKIRWHFTKDDFQFPMATLGSVKASLNLLATLSVLDSAVANFHRVPNSDSTTIAKSLERISALEKEACRTERQFSDSMRVLHEQSRPNGHPDSAGNIHVIAVIIEEIKKGAVAEARDLVKKLSTQSQVAPPTGQYASSQLTSADDTNSQSPAFVRTSRYSIAEDQIRIRLRDPSLRARSYTGDGSHLSVKEHTPVGSELKLREVRDRSLVSSHHADQIMVEPEMQQPISHVSEDMAIDNSHSPSASRSLYQPMPPFSESDLRERETRNHRRRSRSRSQRGG
ncbi:hypothetical protein PITC_086080 [Penicillium italicum]|uniref:Uncharacterized protein n=1 Tax=Penicillium italicum TaxID=40296 RepID=A0A0A2KZV4_PENIT|nr:hypothetical protein PITC_086080 [Penicillium italicum]